MSKPFSFKLHLESDDEMLFKENEAVEGGAYLIYFSG